MRSSGILFLFIVIASLIATRKLPAMIALPLMAVGIGFCAGIPIYDYTEVQNGTNVIKQGILTAIIEGNPKEGKGMFMLSLPIIYSLLGGMFARFINDAKIAERLIKYAAEFGGEDPFFISIMMSAVTALVFTAIGGLPAVIMLGTIMFPILLSLGISPVVCGSLLVLAFPVGTALAPMNWANSAALYGIDQSLSRSYFVSWGALQFAVLLIFLVIEFLRMKRTNVTLTSMAKSTFLVVFSILILAFIGKFEMLKHFIPSAAASVIDNAVYIREKIFRFSQIAVTALLLFGILHTQWRYLQTGKLTTQWNLLTPLLPLILILMLGFDKAYGAAFIASMGYGFLTTPGDRSIQRLGKTIMAGIGDIAAPVVLMLGIGMLVSAATHPITNDILTPVFARVIPDTNNAYKYVLFFAFFSPFALYRGPLNEWGLGVGVARILQSFMPAPATMGAIKAVGLLQDPTTTQNIWVCGYLKLDINAILFKLLPYSFALVVTSLMLSAWLFL